MNSTIDPGAQIGHVHLKVAELDRAVAFYRDVLGFKVTGRIGDQLAFLAAGGYHHHIGLNTLESIGGAPAPGSTGSTTPRSATPPARRWCEALRRVLAQRLSRQPRLRPRRVGVRSTSPIQTATAWSSTGTARSRSGRARPTARSRW